jgi:hypothetical protein
MLGFADAAPESERDSARPLSTLLQRGQQPPISVIFDPDHAATLAHVLEKPWRTADRTGGDAPMPQYRMTAACSEPCGDGGANGAAAECTWG